MSKKDFNRALIYFIVTLAVAACVLSVVFYGESAISIITTTTTLIGIFAIFAEVKRSKGIKHAQFLMFLNELFMMDKSNLIVSSKLNDFIDSNKQTVEKENISDIVDQLDYWSSMAPSILNGLISLKKVDDMLSYRFFRIVNNPQVQQMEIIPYAEYYRGIIKLHKVWTKYKMEYGLPILLGDHSLDKVFADYEKYTE